VVALEGDRAEGLTAAIFRERASGTLHGCALRHLFLFIGAEPNAAWLQHRAALDAKGFVLTGLAGVSAAGPRCRSRPASPATSSSRVRKTWMLRSSAIGFIVRFGRPAC
jgi:alkyl hydroperoxide reductase subunit AhpF